MKRIGLIIFLALILAAPAEAGVVYSDTQRNVTIAFTPPGAIGVTHGVSSRNPGPWTGDAEWSYFGLPATARGSQISNIDSSGLKMSGSLTANSMTNTSASVESLLLAFFTLTDPTPYIASETYDAGITFKYVSAEMYGGAGPRFFFLGDRGVLQPGRYSLGAQFHSYIGPGAGSITGNYTFHIRFVPEPSTGMLLVAASLLLSAHCRRRTAAELIALAR